MHALTINCNNLTTYVSGTCFAVGATLFSLCSFCLKREREREFDFSGFGNFPNIRIYSDFRKFCYKVKIARNKVSRVQCNPSNQIKCTRNCHVIICNIKLKKKKLADSTDFFYFLFLFLFLKKNGPYSGASTMSK